MESATRCGMESRISEYGINAGALHGIRNSLRYGISPQASMESMQEHCKESATRCGMESRISEHGINAKALHGIKSEGKRGYTASRDAIRPMGNSIQFAQRIDAMHKPIGLE